MMKKLLLALALLWPLHAGAQTYPNHSTIIGAGPGVKSFKTAGPCLNGQALIWSGVSADPACGTPSAGSIIVGTSVITGGTPGDVLIVGSGPVLQQAGVTGTLGSVVQSAAPTIDSPTITTAFTATGLVTNADLVNTATTVNGTSCTLGSTCTATAAAGTLTGATLAAGVTASSLTSFGNAPTVANAVLSGTPTGAGSSIVVNGVTCSLAGSCTVNPPGGASTTVNGQTCTLGGTCTVTVDAGTLTGTTLAAGVVTSSLTSVGTIASGLWQGTSIALAHGGTNANLTASNGGIVYSTASALAILAGTATPAQCLQSQANSAPIWASCSGAAAVSSVADDGNGTLVISPTTGAVVAALNLGNANTWTAIQTFTNSDVKLLGSSTGKTTFTSANAGASNYTATWPANTGTIAELNLAQTWTANQSFNDGTLLLNGSGNGNSTIKAPATGGGVATLQAGNGTLFYPLSNATLVTTGAGNPTGTTSASGIMAGIGSTCTITPATTGRVRFTITGYMTNTTSSHVTRAYLYYGTGTAPTNGASPTGTVLGNAVQASINVANYQTPFVLIVDQTGLSPGTAYWFDADVVSVSGSGTAAIASLNCSAQES